MLFHLFHAALATKYLFGTANDGILEFEIDPLSLEYPEEMFCFTESDGSAPKLVSEVSSAPPLPDCTKLASALIPAATESKDCLDKPIGDCCPYSLLESDFACLCFDCHLPKSGCINRNLSLRRVQKDRSNRPLQTCWCLSQAMILYPITYSIDAACLVFQPTFQTCFPAAKCACMCLTCNSKEIRRLYRRRIRACWMDSSSRPLCKRHAKICPNCLETY
jgi:hypothetical protein